MNQVLERPGQGESSMGRPGSTVLSLEGLSKRFGDIAAVSGLDLDIRAGEVLGLLGPNGAGKSTVVGMVLGLVKPTAGRVVFHGVSRSRVGAIIETPAFYPFLSGLDNLRALAMLSGRPDDRELLRLLDLVGLSQAARRKCKGYSLGMKQRLGLASTLLGDPQLVILDEPTNGLDPAGQQEVREIIPRLVAEGRAVVVTSHLLHDVEQVCDRIAILQAGRLRLTGYLDELLSRDHHIELRVAEPRTAVEVLRRLPAVTSVTLAGGLIQVSAAGRSAAAISMALAQAGLYVESMVEKSESLEDLFFEVTGRSEEERS